MKVTKADLISRVRKKVKLSRQEIKEIIEAFMEEIKEALFKGERIELRGFGTFYVKERGERPARNPRTGETVVVKKRKVAVFRPGRELQKTLRELT